jgi:hypothetical protein
MKEKKIPNKFQDWIDARKRHHLSHAHIQMAREIGLNPKKFGKLDNHKQEQWKEPLSIFIESLYQKRFSKICPDEVKSIEKLFQLQQQKKAVKKLNKLANKQISPLLQENDIAVLNEATTLPVIRSKHDAKD